MVIEMEMKGCLSRMDKWQWNPTVNGGSIRKGPLTAWWLVRKVERGDDGEVMRSGHMVIGRDQDCWGVVRWCCRGVHGLGRLPGGPEMVISEVTGVVEIGRW
jgi:hypothetical protein